MNRRKKTNYYHISFFDRFFNDLKKMRNGFEFEFTKTTYTRRLDTKNCNMVFNDIGNQDIKVLGLINNVRGDALKYIDSGFKPIKGDFNYFGLLDEPVTGEVISKIDIRSAYWQLAINKGIISEETDRKLTALYDGYPVEELKSARLKALGSLATRKDWRRYKDGKIIESEIFEQPTRELYIDINRSIDSIMRGASGVVDGVFYYYWDCLFVKDKFTKDAIDYFKSKNFDVKVESTKLDFIMIGNLGYLVCQTTDKIYMTGRDNIHLIKHLI